jgi:alkylation response protein AidB-like acyl-CoA dehydrogenase
MDFDLTSEQAMLKETVSKFVDRQVIPKAPEIDQDGTFPKENFAAMAELGLFGISIPAEYGGIGADLMSSLLVMEQLSRGGASTANTYGSHAILCTENIYRNGTRPRERNTCPT